MSMQQAVQYWWKQHWDGKQNQWKLIGVEAPGHKVVNLHKNLHKAESAVLTQIQTRRIGLVVFLNKVQVSDHPSRVCQCSQANETAAHIIVHCTRFSEAHSSLRDYHTGLIDLKSLVDTAKGVQHLAK